VQRTGNIVEVMGKINKTQSPPFFFFLKFVTLFDQQRENVSFFHFCELGFYFSHLLITM
jgi:hypothetical protein